MIAHPATVYIQAKPQYCETQKYPARFSHPAGRLQIEAVKSQALYLKQAPCFEREKRRDAGATKRHQKGDERVHAAHRQEASQKNAGSDDLFRPSKRVAFLTRLRLRDGERRPPKTEIQSVVRADADAIHALHTARIDNHPELFHFRMDQHVRSAGGRAMPALIAGVRDANLAGRYTVGETEEAAVRTGVGAETLRAQKIDGHEAADEKKRNGDGERGKGFPKIAGYQMVGKLGNERLGRGACE